MEMGEGDVGEIGEGERRRAKEKGEGECRR